MSNKSMIKPPKGYILLPLGEPRCKDLRVWNEYTKQWTGDKIIEGALFFDPKHPVTVGRIFARPRRPDDGFLLLSSTDANISLSNDTDVILLTINDKQIIFTSISDVRALARALNSAADKAQQDRQAPCPCCGFRPDKNSQDFCYPTGTGVVNLEDGNQSYKFWNAHCYEGFGGCGRVSVLGKSEEEAIKLWNTRYEQPDND